MYVCCISVCALHESKICRSVLLIECVYVCMHVSVATLHQCNICMCDMCSDFITHPCTHACTCVCVCASALQHCKSACRVSGVLLSYMSMHACVYASVCVCQPNTNLRCADACTTYTYHTYACACVPTLHNGIRCAHEHKLVLCTCVHMRVCVLNYISVR